MSDKIEVAKWIANIIESCTDDFHFEAADKLIDLFAARFNCLESCVELAMLRKDVWNRIHAIVN